MTYQITILKQGATIETVTGIQATDATAAIASIEARYQAKAVTLSDRGGAVQSHRWTGYEFQARWVG